MGFYLFSFHVHEKQILLPLLFFGLLIHDMRHFFSLFVTTTTFSLAKLFTMDKSHASYLPLMVGFHYFMKRFEACMVNSYRIGQTHSGIVVYNEQLSIISQIKS